MYSYLHIFTSLLRRPFVTVMDYLHALRTCAQSLAVLGPKAMFYLAAAVSDFYIPTSALPHHKMPSAGRGGTLALELAAVPKCLAILRSSWAPEAYVVAFKLETDWDLLRLKVRTYSHIYIFTCSYICD